MRQETENELRQKAIDRFQEDEFSKLSKYYKDQVMVMRKETYLPPEEILYESVYYDQILRMTSDHLYDYVELTSRIEKGRIGRLRQEE